MSVVARLTRFSLDELRFRRVHRKYRRYTMLQRTRFTGNLHIASRVANVPGSIVECGTWRGGMIAGIEDVLGSARKYDLCDSFRGFRRPKKSTARRLWLGRRTPRAPTTTIIARRVSSKPGRQWQCLAQRTTVILEGWFEDTLPKFPPGPVALLRLDGDWYDPTKSALENLASRVVPGGFIIIDDYHDREGCAVAVNEFAARQKWKIHLNHHGVCYIAT